MEVWLCCGLREALEGLMGPSLRAWIKAGVVLNVPLLGPSSPLSGAVLGPSRPPQAPRPLLVPSWAILEPS